MYLGQAPGPGPHHQRLSLSATTVQVAQSQSQRLRSGEKVVYKTVHLRQEPTTKNFIKLRKFRTLLKPYPLLAVSCWILQIIHMRERSTHYPVHTIIMTIYVAGRTPLARVVIYLFFTIRHYRNRSVQRREAWGGDVLIVHNVLRSHQLLDKHIPTAAV